MPVTAGLKSLNGQWISAYHLIATGSLVAALPPVLIFFAMQKHFIAGLTLALARGNSGMIKLAMIGAAPFLDILLEPCFNGCTVALQDIDPKRLQTSLLVVRATDTSPVITATEDRREALRDADFVVLMIQVAGYEAGHRNRL